MKHSKYLTEPGKVAALLALLTSLALGLSACGGGSSSSPPTYTLSGQVTSAANPAGEPGVTIKATYENGSPSVSTTTSADGTYTLAVAQNWTLYLSLSKAGFVTLNSAKGQITANEVGLDLEMVDTATVQMAIDIANAGAVPGLTLASKGWLAVEIDDANDDPLAGETISNNPPPNGQWYTLCDGTNSGGFVTVVDTPGNCNGRLVMYLAYWDSATDTQVTAIGETETVPIKIGEVSFTDFML